MGQIQSPAESSIQGSGTTQASATKRKRSSKADELPSLQDAPGLPEKLGDQPLRLIIVGHNPSDHAWYAATTTQSLAPSAGQLMLPAYQLMFPVSADNFAGCTYFGLADTV